MKSRNYHRRVSERQSARAIRGWKIRRLRMEANPREPSFEEIIAQDKADRKGNFYATMEREGLKLSLYYSLNRSDQFDVVAVRPSRFDGAPGVEARSLNLSMPKVMKLFATCSLR